MKHLSPMTLVLTLMALMLLVSGCSREARMQKALANARQQVREQDFASAEIEYLRVLQLDPHEPEALAGLGVVYYDQGRFSVAVPILVKAVELTPEDLDVRLKVASLYLTGGRSAEAQEQAEFILSREPTNAEAALIFVEASLARRQMAEAREFLRSLPALNGNPAIFPLAEALFLMSQGKYSEAAMQAQQAIAMEPGFDGGYLILGDALSRQGREAEGREALKTSYGLADVRSRRKFRWIDYLMEKGDLAAARTLLEQLNDQGPAYFPVLIRRARVELQAGELAESEVWLEKALALDGGSFEVLSLRGELLIAQGNTKDALKLLERVVQMAPQSTPLSFQLATAYLQAGDNAAALSQLSRTIELSPGWFKPRLLRVEVALRMGDTDGALIWVDELLRVAPEDRGALILRAEALRLSGSLDRAASVYRRLLEKNPEDTEALFRLGQIRFLQNDPVEARRLFEAALSARPNYLPSLSALADMDLNDNNLEAAIQRVRKQLEQNPNALGPKFLLSQIYLAQGASDAAEKELNEVIELAPTWRPPHLILARFYVDSGQVDSARSRLNELLSGQPNDERATIMLAMLDETESLYSRAAQLYENLLQVHPDNVLALNNLAYLYSTHLPNLDRALELISAARAKQPRDPSITDTFGWVLLCRGEHRRALGILRALEPQLKLSPESSYHLGLAYYLAGLEEPANTYLEAAIEPGKEFFGRDDAMARVSVLNVGLSAAGTQTEQILETALQRDPADPVALVRVAALLRDRGDDEAEQALYEAALVSDPSSIPALIGLSRLAAATSGGQERALQLAKTARGLAPKDPVVAYTLGKLAFQAGDYLWALSLLRECYRELPDRMDVLNDLAWAYYSVGQLEQAEQSMREVVNKASTGQEEARQSLDLLVRQRVLGDPAEAKQLADSALQKQPKQAAARMVLGRVAEQEGRSTQALALYQDVLKTYPAFAPAMKRIAVLAAGDLHDDSIAYSYGLKARDYYPADAELSMALGQVMFRRGNYQYAIQLLKEAAPAHADDVNLLYYLGLAQYQTKELEAARKTLTRAIGLNPDHPLTAQAKQALKSI